MNNFTIKNEKALLKKVSQGDEEAFSQIFYAYHNKLGAYVYRFTESREAAEDIVQEVFLKIWTDREKLATVERFGAYLYVLSRNHTLNRLRQLAKKRVKEKEALEALKQSSPAIETKENDPDYYEIMDRAVEKLPPQQHKVYTLKYRKHLKYKEIAQQMGISPETVKKYLKLAKQSITKYAQSNHDLLVIGIFLGSLFLI